jgi:hypothetical protein
MRQAYLGRLEPFVAARRHPTWRNWARPGWNSARAGSGRTCRWRMPVLNRDRDIASGHTGVGPHRADWRLAFAGLPGGEALSSRPGKAGGAGLHPGPSGGVADEGQGWPWSAWTTCVRAGSPPPAQVLQSVLESGAQVLLTGTRRPKPSRTGAFAADVPRGTRAVAWNLNRHKVPRHRPRLEGQPQGVSRTTEDALFSDLGTLYRAAGALPRADAPRYNRHSLLLPARLLPGGRVQLCENA